NDNSLVYFLTVNVSPNFEGRGISQRMISLSMELIKQRGFKVVEATTGSPVMKHIFEKNGFKKVVEIPFRDYLVNGISPVPKDKLYTAWTKDL
ncbi:unnamed protein product, partial [Cyprideis torosa]